MSTHTRKHTNILLSCRVTYGGLFSCSVAHYISHYVFTHIWPILCTCWGVIYQLSVHTCSSSSSSLYSSISPFLPSISHSSSLSLHLSTCLPCCPPHHPPRVFVGDHAVAKATAAIVYPVARWLVAVAMIKNSEAPPCLPLPLLLPSINKSSPFFPFLHSIVVLPSLLSTLVEEKHGDLSGGLSNNGGTDDGLFGFISYFSFLFSPSRSTLFFSSLPSILYLNVQPAQFNNELSLLSFSFPSACFFDHPS